MSNLGAYQEFTTRAGQVGGVEKLIDIISESARQDGLKTGNQNVGIAVLLSLVASTLITTGVLKRREIVEFVKNRFGKAIITSEEAIAAKEALMQEIQKYEEADTSLQEDNDKNDDTCI